MTTEFKTRSPGLGTAGRQPQTSSRARHAASCRRIASLLAVCLSALGFPTSRAATYTWDATSGDSGITDGSGNWRVGVGNWVVDGTTFDQVWANSNGAVFGGGTAGAAGTVTLTGNIAVQTLTLNAANGGGGYTIDVAGRKLSLTLARPFILGANSSIVDSSGTGFVELLNATNGGTWNTGTLTISARLAGAADVSFAHRGSGSVVLSNDGNAFGGLLSKQNSGSITLTSIRNIGEASAAGAGGEVAVGIGAQLVYAGSGDTTDRLLTLFGTGNVRLTSSGSGPIVFGGSIANTSTAAKTLFLDGTNGGGNELRGVLADSGANPLAVIKEGAGTWLLSGANGYTGGTIVRAGTLQLGTGGTTGSLMPAGSLSGLADATLAFNRSDVVTQGVDFAAVIGGALKVAQVGSGTLVLNAANTYSGATTVSAGTLQVSDALATGSSSVSITTGATLAVATGTAMRAPAVVVSGGTLAAETLLVNSSTGITSLAVNSGSLAGSPTVTIGAGGGMTLAGQNRVTVAVGGLAVEEGAGGGLLDVGAGRVSIGPGGITAEQLRSDILAGRAGGAWNGTTGITSSAAGSSSGTRAVGYVVNPDGSAAVSFAAAGDVDLSGQVNVFDLVSIDSAGKYGSGQPSVWNEGDFNYDGITNVFDLIGIDTAGAYGAGNYFPPAPAANGGLSTVAVPEPDSVMLLAAAMAGLAASAGRLLQPRPGRRNEATVS